MSNNTLFKDEKLGFVDSTIMLAKLIQPWNASLLKVVTLFGIVMLARLVQLLNAPELIVVNKLFVGKVTVASLEQL